MHEESLSAVVPVRGACFRCDAELRYAEIRAFGGLTVDWEGRTDADLFSPAVAARVQDAKHRALDLAQTERLVESLPLEGASVRCVMYLAPQDSALRGLVLEVEALAQLVDERNLMRHLTDLSSDYGYVVKFTHHGGIELEWTATGLYQSTGYTLDELRERGGWPTLIHSDDRQLLMREIEAAVRESTHAGEFRLVAKSGTVRWIGNRARILPDDSGSGELRVIGAARDVTEQKHAEEAARRLQDELAHVMRLSTLGEMASGIAHELNQPLAAIINHADACAMTLNTVERVPEPVRRDLEQIATQAERAGEIIRRLRGLVAKRDSQLQVVEINQCVQDVVSLVRSWARNRRVALQVELGEPPSVLVDPVQVQQVVLSIVQNAFDAVSGCDAPRRKVRVTTERVPAGAAICVRDYGDVVDDSIVEHMFDPFFSTKPEGLGMGLTIGRTIADNCGGSLEAEALAEGGMRLWLVLPEAAAVRD